jgi:hypothetical protein
MFEEVSMSKITREIVIVGTLHLPADDYPAYADQLKGIIKEISPDVICSELSPEQLAGTQTCNSKPEQRDVIMPTARELGIPIIPIQQATDDATEWEQRYKKVDADLRSQSPDQDYIKYGELLAHQEAVLWSEEMKDKDCIVNLQLNEYHVFSEARDHVESQLLPDRERLLEEWNESFLDVIENTIEQNEYRRILVLAGLWHKYWLWKRLRQRKDIVVHNLQSFRQTEGTLN